MKNKRNNFNSDVDMKHYPAYEKVRNNIVFRLVNTKRNREVLKDIPHMEFMDLSIIFRWLVSRDETGNVSMLIHYGHMKLWGVTIEELYQTAKENTPKLEEYRIMSMAGALNDVINPKNPEEFTHDGGFVEFLNSMPMYVLSNINRTEGSACMLYPNLIRDFSNTVGSSLYIIPSSVHELILLPTEDFEHSGEIRRMIKEINDTQVQPEEILSNSLYCYDREEGKLCIC